MADNESTSSLLVFQKVFKINLWDRCTYHDVTLRIYKCFDQLSNQEDREHQSQYDKINRQIVFYQSFYGRTRQQRRRRNCLLPWRYRSIENFYYRHQVKSTADEQWQFLYELLGHGCKNVDLFPSILCPKNWLLIESILDNNNVGFWYK